MSDRRGVPPHTALVVPVPAASELCQLLANGTRRRTTAPVAHITIATPFLPENELSAPVIRTIQTIARSVACFDFVLTSCGEFDNGWFYASPAHPQPFVQLTRSVLAAFPAVRPYGGQYADILPHLSIGVDHDSTSRRHRMAESERSLPLTATATELLLVRSGPDDWVSLLSFPLEG